MFMTNITISPILSYFTLQLGSSSAYFILKIPMILSGQTSSDMPLIPSYQLHIIYHYPICKLGSSPSAFSTLFSSLYVFFLLLLSLFVCFFFSLPGSLDLCPLCSKPSNYRLPFQAEKRFLAYTFYVISFMLEARHCFASSPFQQHGHTLIISHLQEDNSYMLIVCLFNCMLFYSF